MTAQSTVTVYVELLDEGTPTARPTQAIPLSSGLYKLLPLEEYDPEDEKWQFLPGAVARCESVKLKSGQVIFKAVEEVNVEK